MADSYEYKCVPAPKGLTISASGSEANAITAFGDRINESCTDGWEFVSMGQISVTTKPDNPGCLGGLLILLGVIQKPTETRTNYNMLVFRKRK